MRDSGFTYGVVSPESLRRTLRPTKPLHSPCGSKTSESVRSFIQSAKQQNMSQCNEETKPDMLTHEDSMIDSECKKSTEFSREASGEVHMQGDHTVLHGQNRRRYNCNRVSGPDNDHLLLRANAIGNFDNVQIQLLRNDGSSFNDTAHRIDADSSLVSTAHKRLQAPGIPNSWSTAAPLSNEPDGRVDASSSFSKSDTQRQDSLREKGMPCSAKLCRPHTCTPITTHAPMVDTFYIFSLPTSPYSGSRNSKH